MRLHIMDFMSNLLGYIDLLGIAGLAILLLSETKLIAGFFSKHKERMSFLQKISPLLIRLSYIVAGYVLIIFASTISSGLFQAMIPAGTVANLPNHFDSNFSTLMFLKYQSQFAGLFGTLMFMFSGAFLTLSAGNEWLVHVAKVIGTISVLYLIVSAVAYVG